MYKHIEFTTWQSLLKLLQNLLIRFWFQFPPCLFIYMPQRKTHQVVGYLPISFLCCASAALSQPWEAMSDGDPRDLSLFSFSHLSCLWAEHCCTASTSSMVGFRDPWKGPLLSPSISKYCYFISNLWPWSLSLSFICCPIIVFLPSFCFAHILCWEVVGRGCSALLGTG